MRSATQREKNRADRRYLDSEFTLPDGRIIFLATEPFDDSFTYKIGLGSSRAPRSNQATLPSLKVSGTALLDAVLTSAQRDQYAQMRTERETTSGGMTCTGSAAFRNWVMRHFKAYNNVSAEEAAKAGKSQENATLLEESIPKAEQTGEIFDALTEADRFHASVVLCSPLDRTCTSAILTLGKGRKPVADETIREMASSGLARHARLPTRKDGETDPMIDERIAVLLEIYRSTDPRSDGTTESAVDIDERILDALEHQAKIIQILATVAEDRSRRIDLPVVTHKGFGRRYLKKCAPGEFSLKHWPNGEVHTLDGSVESWGDVTDPEWRAVITFTGVGPVISLNNQKDPQPEAGMGQEEFQAAESEDTDSVAGGGGRYRTEDDTELWGFGKEVLEY
ncbi:uncharacterized protein MKK02DRAFT_45773 [Dioszegia hungarica]|uniref:Uncharacterized protein n=1 Tax=Dioszegia hungarica TaxID=4972 RepID=A0AA38LWS1_9TREE|nr:uncharacterized protein MKK02DRAFT_45773 [Dioszegia hungarica]KAI9637064.1 hypothetical protein MKK02DRAFT_45773 [Dioszegia hungarica]